MVADVAAGALLRLFALAAGRLVRSAPTCAAIILSLLFLATGSIWAVLAADYIFNVMQIVAAQWMGLQPLRAA